MILLIYFSFFLFFFLIVIECCTFFPFFYAETYNQWIICHITQYIGTQDIFLPNIGTKKKKKTEIVQPPYQIYQKASIRYNHVTRALSGWTKTVLLVTVPGQTKNGQITSKSELNWIWRFTDGYVGQKWVEGRWRCLWDPSRG